MLHHRMLQESKLKKKSGSKAATYKDLNLQKVIGFLIFAVGFIIYSNTLHHNYALDDFSTIRENRITTGGLKSIPDIFNHFYRYGYYNLDDGIYRPLSVAIFAMEWSISPNNPELAHWVNVLLYALSGVILFFSLAKILRGYTLVLPSLAVLLFITHPIHTEVVCNIKSLDEILSFLFSCVALLVLYDYIETRSILKLSAGVLFYFLALLSKEDAITMLACFPLIFYFFKSDKKKEIIISAGGMGLAVLGFLLLRMFVLSKSAHAGAVDALLNPLISATNPLHRFTNEIRLLGYYVRLLIYPNPLLYDYSYNHFPLAPTFDFFSVSAFLAYVGLCIYAVVGFIKKQLLSIGVLFYLIALSVYSNVFFILGVSMAERFIYFASFGFCFSLTILLMKLTKTKIHATSYSTIFKMMEQNRLVMFLAFSIAFTYMVLTVKRNRDWKDNYTLFSHDIRYMPNNARAHSFLGNEIIRKVRGEKDKQLFFDANMAGIAELKRSLAIYPKSVEVLNCIGASYLQIDSMERAKYYYREALQLDPNDMSYMANWYLVKRDYDQAILLYEKILKRNPNNVDALVYSGIAYGTIKNYSKAIACFQNAVILQPSSPKINYYLSTAYKFNNDSVNSVVYFQKAYSLDNSLTMP